MRELNVNEFKQVNGGGEDGGVEEKDSPWTTPNAESGQNCLNEMVEMGGVGAIGGALGGPVGSFVGAIIGAFGAFVGSEECKDAKNA
ncbi:hypothetical protein [Paraglaciecola aestuariivivens]